MKMENTKFKKTYNEVRTMQAIPYEIKIEMSRRRIIEYAEYYGADKLAVAYSGGLDSTMALHFIRSIYPEVKAISVLAIECKENIEQIRTTENVEPVAPRYTQQQVIKKFGYPVVSKKTSKAIRRLRNPSERNLKSRNLALTGITSEGKKAGTYKLAIKWRFLINAPFEISDRCCYYMKETPMINYAKKKGYAVILATMAEESKSRMDGYCKRGHCNTFDELGLSTPFIFWTRNDMLRYIDENGVKISEAYGEIKQFETGEYYTTKAQRTGCPICMFGMDREGKDGNPNRFQRMYYDDYKMWYKAVFEWGYKEVLDYFIENGFVNYQYYPSEILEKMKIEEEEKINGHQMNIFDYPEVIPN
jgi:3'-phosphoadenosine 5'-phosphosulfate sulfotransferase (PAPS reductase)/FAD synthetase